jgi:transposase-like protein
MASNIIKFPSVSKRKLPLTDVLVDRLTDSTNHVDIGNITFTCPPCEQTSSFNFTGVIFKNLTFYCANCGHGYKISNPMFSNTPQIKSK